MLHNKLLKEYDWKPRTYIAEDETDTGKIKFLCCEIDGYEYSFIVDWVPEDKLEWFADIYSRHLKELKDRTEKKVRKEISNKFDEFLKSIGKK